MNLVWPEAFYHDVSASLPLRVPLVRVTRWRWREPPWLGCGLFKPGFKGETDHRPRKASVGRDKWRHFSVARRSSGDPQL